ncbi:uncharacterized protein LOC132393582 [Hypanus sabinus]|uniref:uncharacterized protein LOC132393582 n=1 Tax=Hypanus sabinus TaxID=79690 RepID=UPI0028C3D0AA|nr:uncharacterized protein LOC132393582 [Hypanus sabinus]
MKLRPLSGTRYWTLNLSWFIGSHRNILLVPAVCALGYYFCWRFRVRQKLRQLRVRLNECYRYFYPRTLYCQVECYGQGKIHHDIMRQLNITEGQEAPLVLFVYKVSRETEDLRNALQWIEGSRGRKSEGICAVILLEKSWNKQNKLVEVAHQGIFDANCLVVRILWEHPWYSPARAWNNPSNREAMDKVKQRIMEWQRSPVEGDP